MGIIRFGCVIMCNIKALSDMVRRSDSCVINSFDAIHFIYINEN